MKIALLTNGMHPHVLGGMQKHSFYLAKYFAQNKVNVDLYHPAATGIKEDSFLKNFSDEEAKYIHPVFIKSPNLFYFPGHYIYESYLFSRSIFQKYIQAEAVDFIYAQGFTAWELIRQRKLKNRNLPPIGLNFHGLNMFQPSFGLRNYLNNILFKPYIKYNIQKADFVFSLGRKLTQLIHQNTQTTKNIIEIPVGIDPSWLIDASEITINSVLNFIFIGRYDKVKGLKLLNLAIEKAFKRDIAFVFNFIGPIPDNVQIRHKNVKYHGEIQSEAELKKILKQNDIIINCSYSEGMPTVILEAMACGLAVIATDVGAVNELIDEENGILIPPGNSTAIEEAIAKFVAMSLKQLLEMKTHSLRKVQKRFLWGPIITQTINEIEKIITIKNK